MLEYGFCHSVVDLYAVGERILRSCGTIFTIDSTDLPNDCVITADDIRQAIASEDAYRREYARAGIDYPSMQPLNVRASKPEDYKSR